jgi:hypothetical protein
MIVPDDFVWKCAMCGESKRHYPGSVFCDDCEKEVDRTVEADSASSKGVVDKFDRTPAFETMPEVEDIARWYIDEMRDEPNVGGDAWWLIREPHASCRRLAVIDWDVQEFVLLDIAIDGFRNLLLVSYGLDGTFAKWWNHPVTAQAHVRWERDGIVWMADQMMDHRARNSDA